MNEAGARGPAPEALTAKPQSPAPSPNAGPRAGSPPRPAGSQPHATPPGPFRAAAANPIPTLATGDVDDATLVVHTPLKPAPVAPVPPAHVEPPEDIEARIRSAVQAAVRPLQQSVVDMQRQLEQAQELVREHERALALAEALGQARLINAVASPVAASYLPPAIALASRPAPPIDLAAIARDTSIQIDPAFNGSWSKRRAVSFLVLTIVTGFGSLIAALVLSYLPH